jgi:hypothetical protein
MPYVSKKDVEAFAWLTQQIGVEEKKSKVKPLLSAGRYGFSDFFNQFQDAMLKKEDPQKTLVKQGMEAHILLDKIEKNTRVPIGTLK